MEAKVRALYAHQPRLLARYPSIHSVSLDMRLKRSTLVLQMWVKQVRQQELLTDLARQKAQMATGSIEKFLQPQLRRKETIALQLLFRLTVTRSLVFLHQTNC